MVIGMLTSSVLSVLAVLLAAGWWWVTWPERTASEFVSLVAREDFEAANAMIVVPDGSVWGMKPDGTTTWYVASFQSPSGVSEPHYLRCFRSGKLTMSSRSVFDLAACRAAFDVGGVKLEVKRSRLAVQY